MRFLWVVEKYESVGKREGVVMDVVMDVVMERCCVEVGDGGKGGEKGGEKGERAVKRGAGDMRIETVQRRRRLSIVFLRKRK